MKERRQQDIVVRAFVVTGHDPPEGLFEYINVLEDATLRMHRKLTNRERSLSRANIHLALKEGLAVARDRFSKVTSI